MNGHPVHPPGREIWKSEVGELSRSLAALGLGSCRGN
jgi:hypothetical protein